MMRCHVNDGEPYCHGHNTLQARAINRVQENVCMQGTTLTFVATFPVGQVRFDFHLPDSNLHLPLKKCMFYVLFKTK